MDNDNLIKHDLDYLKLLYSSYYDAQMNLKKRDLKNMINANKNRCTYINNVYSELEGHLINCPGCTSQLSFSNSPLTSQIQKAVETCN